MLQALATLPARVNLLPTIPFLLVATGYCLIKIFGDYGLIGPKFDMILPLLPIWMVLAAILVVKLIGINQ